MLGSQLGQFVSASVCGTSLVLQESMDSKKRLVSEMSSSQEATATDEYTNLNPFNVEDAQQIRVPTKRFRSNEVSGRDSPNQSRFSGAHDAGATVFSRKLVATENLGATAEQLPGFPVQESCVSNKNSRPVKKDCMLFGINLIDDEQENICYDSRDEPEKKSNRLSLGTDHYKPRPNPKRSRTKV